MCKYDSLMTESDFLATAVVFSQQVGQRIFVIKVSYQHLNISPDLTLKEVVRWKRLNIW